MDRTPAVSFILGTRPEVIKCSPLLRACRAHGIPFNVIHTGQHYDDELDTVFFEQLDLPEPGYNLEIGSALHGKQTGEMMVGLESILMAETPAVVLVQGDTNSVLAGGLVGSKLECDVGHVEAGLRSYQKDMPEEINRKVVDHIADLLFAPTEHAATTLAKEGIPSERVFVTGNPIVDAVTQNKQIAKQKSTILEDLSLRAKEFAVLTLHRESNVHSAKRFQTIMNAIGTFTEETATPVVYPIHPGARAKLKEFEIQVPTGIRITDPMDYLDFLHLQEESSVIFTDSGGVQEEACILGIPCVTLRDATERPETVEVGANVIVNSGEPEIWEQGAEALDSEHSWENPFGDGTAGEQIIEILQEQYTL